MQPRLVYMELLQYTRHCAGITLICMILVSLQNSSTK